MYITSFIRYPLLCEIGNPLKRGEKKEFDVELDVSDVGRIGGGRGRRDDMDVIGKRHKVDSLPIAAEVTTSSTQKLEQLADNRFWLKLDVRRDVNLKIFGHVNPEAILFYQVLRKQGRIRGQYQSRKGGQGQKCMFSHSPTRADGRTDGRTNR